MRPPNLTAPPPRRAVMPSRRTPAASKVAMPLTSSRALRKHQRAHPAVGQQRVAGHHRRRRRSRNPRRHFGATGAADVGQEALEHGEVRGAVGLQRQRLVVQVHRAAQVELGVVTDHLQRIDLQHLMLDAQSNRRLVAQPVIEQRDVDLLDGGVDAQRVRIVELADDADACRWRSPTCMARTSAAADGDRDRATYR